jgi:hypothetical protein
MTYLPIGLLLLLFLDNNFEKSYLNNLTSQMVHYSLIKMTSQMVFALLAKKTTLITLDMLKLTCPK